MGNSSVFTNDFWIGFAIVAPFILYRFKDKIFPKQNAEELKKSQAFLDSMIENLPNMVFVKDAEQLRFVRFNKAGETLLGFSRQQLIGKNDFDLFPKEQADFFIAKDRAVLSGHAVVDIPEELIETKEKGTRILHTRKIPIFDNHGKPVYLLGISEDITDWKRAEGERLERIREQAALEERENAARKTAFLAEVSTLLASSMDYHTTLKKMAELVLPNLGDWCTITLLKNGKNERVVAVHRDSKKAALLDELSKNYPALESASNHIAQVIQSGNTFFTSQVKDEDLNAAAIDARHLELMRELGCTSCIIAPIASRSKTLGAIVFVSANKERVFDAHDVTIAEELGRRAAVAIDNAFLYETAQNAIQARDEFLSIASHELKTPITSLKLQVQLTRRNTKPEEGVGPTPEKLAKMLDVSGIQIQRITSLIDDLLDVSRIEAGKLSFDFELLDLSLLVKETLEHYEDHFKQSGCSIQFQSPGPIFVSGDRFRMEQVILNILTNATKYGRQKPISISIEEMGQQVHLICRDEGIGIPADRVSHIFGRFERAVSSSNIGGLGLGLYITHEIVKGHHGNIQVESVLGKGTTMTVQLPKTGTA